MVGNGSVIPECGKMDGNCIILSDAEKDGTVFDGVEASIVVFGDVER